jgi:hypothetical protein
MKKNIYCHLLEKFCTTPEGRGERVCPTRTAGVVDVVYVNVVT